MIFAKFLTLVLLAVQAQSPKPVPAPTDPEDPGPPVVKRGANAPRKTSSDKGPNIISGNEGAPTADAPVRTDRPASAPIETAGSSGKEVIDISASIPRRTVNDPLIARAAEASADYTATLPNFICDEIVKRMLSKSKPPSWKKEDTVEVEVMYVDHKEDYRNLRINGKPLKTGSPEETGSWSKGDWGTLLTDVLHPATDAAFKRRGKDKIAGIDCEVFDYTVEKKNSHWQVRYGKMIKPAYKGAIWIDAIDARVLRIEMQARQLPNDYELDAVETMVEYGLVSIKGVKYLMPTFSENLACWRYTERCSKNELAFKNYRKFSAESSISTTESEISFGDKEKPADAPAPSAPPAKKKKP